MRVKAKLPPLYPSVSTPLLPPISMCSDVHLGTGDCQYDEFYKWLKQRRPDETVILVGDILDFWIFSKLDAPGYLVKRVVAAWQELWVELKKLSDKGTTFHFVPGNHDSFVYFIETGDQTDWTKEVLRRSPEMASIREQTKAARMTEVASVHYPFLELTVSGKRILFTHGHYDGWGWRLMGGLGGDLPLFNAPAITTIAMVGAHKYARLLRRGVKGFEWRKRVNAIEDAAISITNAVVRAYYDEAFRDFRRNPSRGIKLLDDAMALYFGGQPSLTPAEEIRMRDALLELSRINGPIAPQDTARVWDSTMNYLRRAGRSENVSLERVNGTSSAQLSYKEFKTFVDPDFLVFGHYHKPRDENPAYDIGGFVEDLKTYLVVKPDGTIYRPLTSKDS